LRSERVKRVGQAEVSATERIGCDRGPVVSGFVRLVLVSNSYCWPEVPFVPVMITFEPDTMMVMLPVTPGLRPPRRR